MRYRFWYISLVSSAKQQRERTKFKVLCRTWTRDSEFSFFFLDCNAVLTETATGLSATLDRLNELKLSRTSLKYLEVIFKMMFSLASRRDCLSSLFNSQRRREKEMRAAEKLCTWNWPAAFELRASFNSDGMTSRIRGQAPKCYPKWRSPMTNFLLVRRGISLGSDTLWKLKQRSVTQLSVVFLLVSTKNLHFLEWPPL